MSNETLCAHCGEPITSDPDSGEWLHEDTDSAACASLENNAEPEGR